MRVNRCLSNKLTAIVLVVAAWFTSLCLFTLPSHACCEQPANYKSKAMAACCASPTLMQQQAPQTGAGLDSATVVFSLPFDFSAFFNPQSTKTNLSRLALRHVPDQSARYLELRVLLN